MKLNQGFEYVAREDAKSVILGSMPGIASIDAQQYYAHPRNLFWSIIAEMFGFDPNLPYPERLAQLKKHRIALWDVAYQCERIGSLDSNIDSRSVVANDFNQLFQTAPQITALFFNGQKAEQLYRKLVLPTLPASYNAIKIHTLPSTSPAHASLSRQEKLRAWLQVRQNLLR